MWCVCVVGGRPEPPGGRSIFGVGVVTTRVVPPSVMRFDCGRRRFVAALVGDAVAPPRAALAALHCRGPFFVMRLAVTAPVFAFAFGLSHGLLPFSRCRAEAPCPSHTPYIAHCTPKFQPAPKKLLSAEQHPNTAAPMHPNKTRSPVRRRRIAQDRLRARPYPTHSPTAPRPAGAVLRPRSDPAAPCAPAHPTLDSPSTTPARSRCGPTSARHATADCDRACEPRRRSRACEAAQRCGRRWTVGASRAAPARPSRAPPLGSDNPRYDVLDALEPPSPRPRCAVDRILHAPHRTPLYALTPPHARCTARALRLGARGAGVGVGCALRGRASPPCEPPIPDACTESRN